MFEMAAAGRRPKDIAEFASAAGWDGGAGSWTARRVLKMLSNPIDTGSIRNGKEALPGQHEAIVPASLFEQVRETIESRRSRTPGRFEPTVQWHLRGLLKCGRCGRPMSPSVSDHGNLEYRYYRCRSSAGRRPPCEGICISAYEIEKFVLAQITEADWQGATPEQAETLEQFRGRWRQLDERSQSQLLPQIVQEVEFHVDASRVTIRLVHSLTTTFDGFLAMPERANEARAYYEGLRVRS